MSGISNLFAVTGSFVWLPIIISMLSDIGYKFVDLRESEEADATLNYEQDNTLEIDLTAEMEEGATEEKGGKKCEEGEDGDVKERGGKRKRKLNSSVSV